MWASSLMGPGLGFWMVGWLMGNGSHPTLVLFQHGSTPHLHKQLINKDKMSWIALLSVRIYMMAGWVASLVGIPHGTDPRFPS